MIDRAKFYAALRSAKTPLFGASLGANQVKGIEGILDAFGAVGDGRLDTLAYALATAYHETGRRMVPVREGFASTDRGARAAVTSLARQRGPKSAVARYAQPVGPYGHVYYGRGHVQLTWLDNYRKSSADAGVDLVKFPDMMLDPKISARILVLGLLDGRWGGGKGLRLYLDKGDWVGARRTVNIQDKAQQIAGYAKAFMAALDAAKVVTPQPAPKLPHNPRAASKPAQPVSDSYTLPFGGLFDILRKIIGGRK